MDSKIPQLKDVYEFSKGRYPIELIQQTELLVLEILEWKACAITPPQFIEAFLTRGVVFSNDVSTKSPIDTKLLRSIRKYSEFFADLALQEYIFNSFSPHVISCACIASARKSVGLQDLWNKELTLLTRADWEQIFSCVDQLYIVYKNTFPEVDTKPKAQNNSSCMKRNATATITTSASKSNQNIVSLVSNQRVIHQNQNQNQNSNPSNDQMAIEYDNAQESVPYVNETPYKPNDAQNCADYSSCKQEMPLFADTTEYHAQTKKFKLQNNCYPNLNQSQFFQPKSVMKKRLSASQFSTISTEDTRASRSAGKLKYNDMMIEDQAPQLYNNYEEDQSINIRRNLLF